MTETASTTSTPADGSTSGGEATSPESMGKGPADKGEYVETRFEKLNAHNRRKYGLDEGDGEEGGEKNEKKVRTERDPRGTKVEREEGGEPEKKLEKEGTQERVDKQAKVKVTVDGKEREVTQEDLVKTYQKNESGDKKLADAAKVRKEAEAIKTESIKAKAQAESLIHAIRERPLEAFQAISSKLGQDFRKMCEDYIYDNLQRESMDPRDRELQETRERLKRYEDEKNNSEKSQKEEAEKRRMAELQEGFTRDYHKQIIETIDSSGLPKTAWTVKRLAFYVHEAKKRGYDKKPADMVDLVKEDLDQSSRETYDGMEVEDLLKRLPAGVIDKIRKHDLEKAKSNFPGRRLGDGDQNPPKETRTKKKTISRDEWRERMDKIKYDR